jgi:PAS domain S-box-containing protein
MSTTDAPRLECGLCGEERRAARLRARAAGSDTARPRPDLLSGLAFVSLAENVRDYAIFLMDSEGVICYWGEGARLMKWWTKAEAEGSHLRLLYPEDGSEDGTADDHLREAAATGEYTGEGQRIRSDGSTFWAGVTLTALRDPAGQLVGFAKVTRDLTVRRAAEATLALAWSAHATRDTASAAVVQARDAHDVAKADAEIALEQVRSARRFVAQVLEPELVGLQSERAALLSEMASLNAEILDLVRPSALVIDHPKGGA